MQSDYNDYQAMPPPKVKSPRATSAPAAVTDSSTATTARVTTKKEIPFGLKKNEYKKLTKLPSLTNWSAKKNKKKNDGLVIDYWIATGPAEMKDNGYYKGNAGVGYTAGAKSTQIQKFEQKDIDVVEVHFDNKSDSWIIKDKEGKFYRIAWPNAYRNENYPHHASRQEVDDIIASCNGVTIC